MHFFFYFNYAIFKKRIAGREGYYGKLLHHRLRIHRA